MLYNYSNPYTNSSMNMYGGGNNYQPISNVNSQNQQALNPFYQSVYPVNNQRFSAFFVNDYSEEENEKKYMDLVEKFYLKIYGEHFNEKMAMKAVKEMVYIIPDYRFDYTPEQIESLIHQAHQQTSQIMVKYGKTANPIGEKVNKWDKYFVYNMICADYHLSHSGDNKKISMMSYEFLSDPDGCEGKAYRYYKAMSKKE